MSRQILTDGVFTASNGLEVKEGAYGYVFVSFPGGGVEYEIEQGSMQAISEFILHRHGLWLAPNGLICIRQPEENLVGVISKDGDVAYMTRGVRKETWVTHAWVTHAAESAADAYFDAHPELRCDAALEVEGALLRCDQEGSHSVHEGSGQTSRGQGFAVTWETPR